MAYISNNDKMLQAVLMNDRLMKIGDYTSAEISTIYAALDSDNPVINALAQIINRSGEGVSERELWKEINDYLKRNI